MPHFAPVAEGQRARKSINRILNEDRHFWPSLGLGKRDMSVPAWAARMLASDYRRWSIPQSIGKSCARVPMIAKRSVRREEKIEMLFAHLKRILRLGRLRLRGPC
jgi:hypothetical protein